jgi:hypothetical protein
VFLYRQKNGIFIFLHVFTIETTETHFRNTSLNTSFTISNGNEINGLNFKPRTVFCPVSCVTGQLCFPIVWPRASAGLWELRPDSTTASPLRAGESVDAVDSTLGRPSVGKVQTRLLNLRRIACAHTKRVVGVSTQHCLHSTEPGVPTCCGAARCPLGKPVIVLCRDRLQGCDLLAEIDPL